jgi:cardiolipin synthase
VAEAITASRAAERRVLVDDYTRHVINDTFLNCSRDPGLHAEARRTWQMFEGLCDQGVDVRVTNPMDGRWLRYPLRNHKKLLIADDAAWIGGINFSDHNFAWHDLMMRIEAPDVADWFADAFAADWTGAPRPQRRRFGAELELVNLDGVSNAAQFEPLLDSFRGARQTIEVISAYPTFPFVDALAAAAARGVATTIYTPRPSNKPIVRDYLLHLAGRGDVTVRLLPDMTHIKAALIDGETLIAGSSNFDFVSYRTSADYVAIIRAAAVIAQAEASVFGPARATAVTPGRSDAPGWRGLGAALSLRSADAIISRLRHRSHIAEWSAPVHRRRLAERAARR